MNKFLNHRIGTKDLLAAEFILLIVVGFLSNIRFNFRIAL